ncbi:unnamed protein product [Durusdinium trenchii]|uniref:Aldehyde dehydrogenase n=1 Tax=Durusdinium trenchii TaxID=1381693 RepID=A0ABP0L3R2_9DINO
MSNLTPLSARQTRVATGATRRPLRHVARFVPSRRSSMAEPEIARWLPEMRTFVLGGGTSVSWRLEQLELLRTVLMEEKEAILQALDEDLGTGADEGQGILLQLCPILMDIKEAINGLEAWSKPKAIPTPLALQPASCYVQAQPKGVILVLSSWNYPLVVMINPFVSALAAGNACILKPSELAPASAQVMQRIFGRMDQRAVRCVLGGVDVSKSLISMPFDHIAYTGSGRVGKLILQAAAPNLTPVTLELGGKSPVIICGGINIEEACRRIVVGKFSNSGQTCIAPDYVLVERHVRDEVVSKLKDVTREMLGEGAAAAQKMTRLVSAEASVRLHAMLRESHGGTVALGGAAELPQVARPEKFVQPTIVVDPKKESAMMTEEIFGPILPVITVNSCDEAISLINSKEKPLALYIFAPAPVVDHVIASTSSGAVLVGDTSVHKGNPGLPFGGIGGSGTGRLHGIYGFEEFSNMRSVMHRPLAVPSAMRLPVDTALAKAAWMYSGLHPRTLRRVSQVGRLFMLLLVLFVFRRILRWRR